MLEKCQCESANYCEYFDKYMTKPEHQQCQKSQAYRNFLEQRYRPAEEIPMDETLQTTDSHPCECQEPGFCQHFNQYMGQQRWEKCQNDPMYRAHLEKVAKEKRLGLVKIQQPKGPSLGRKAWNFTKALTEHVVTGAKTVSKEVYEQRLNICNDCPSRDGNKCTELGCGCNLMLKCKWKTQACPKGKWHKDV